MGHSIVVKVGGRFHKVDHCHRATSKPEKLGAEPTSRLHYQAEADSAIFKRFESQTPRESNGRVSFGFSIIKYEFLILEKKKKNLILNVEFNRVASAPGKVLLTGGYLILDRPNAGLVLSTNARFFAIVKPLYDQLKPDSWAWVRPFLFLN